MGEIRVRWETLTVENVSRGQGSLLLLEHLEIEKSPVPHLIITVHQAPAAIMTSVMTASLENDIIIILSHVRMTSHLQTTAMAKYTGGR